MSRRSDAERIASLVGDDVLRLADGDSGWPALAEMRAGGAWLPVALYAAPVTLSHRNRDDVERRFQNPGSERPILEQLGRELLLLGIWESDDLVSVKRPVLVSADPHRRIALPSRHSIFVSLAGLKTAAKTGWHEAQTTSGETHRCFLPSLLPLSYEAERSASPPAAAMEVAIEASGLLATAGADAPAVAERARRAGSMLVRDARFSRRVVDAYDGRCAMCGLDVNVVEGAHIYPVSAPGSRDEPWNGIALCPNHHAAFDRHLVGIGPRRAIAFHRTVLDQVVANPAVKALVDGTYARLAEPADLGARPRTAMFTKRYAHYEGSYDWLLGTG